MRVRRIFFTCVVAIAAGGCGGKPAPATGESAPAPAPQAAAAPSAPPSGELAQLIAAADPAQGKIQFIQCRACHSLVPESEPGKIGPTLYGVIGRTAGTARGYSYSEAVARSGITWSADQIDKWLQHPSQFLPGNKMVFVGIEKPQDRANIIAYIEQESTKPAPQ